MLPIAVRRRIGPENCVKGVVDVTTTSESAVIDQRLVDRIAQVCTGDLEVESARPLAAVSAAMNRPGLRLAQVVETAMEGYADRPALGRRAYQLAYDPITARTSSRLLPAYDTITYREFWGRVKAVATEWTSVATAPLAAGDFVCILGFVSTDYLTLNLGCLYLGAVAVPLHTSATIAQNAAIMAETTPQILATGIEYLDAAVEIVLSAPAPQRLVVFDYEPRDDDQRDGFEAARRRLADADIPIEVCSLDEVIDRGSKSEPSPMHLPEADTNPMLALFYTSGSTGAPKGAIYTERMLSYGWLSHAGTPEQSKLPMIILSYLPMSHMAGTAALCNTLAVGGTAYFAAASDMSTLLEDLQLVRPTIIHLVPRVCELIYQRYLTELDQRVEKGSDVKAVSDQLKTELRNELIGGRTVIANCGTAPLSAELKAFIESLLQTHIVDGYGATETGIMAVNGYLRRPPITAYKLIDVPELGYFLTDKPHPRGELLVKSEFLMPGYFKRADVTAEVIDSNGFYKTGDIMAEVGPDQLTYVDRRNNVLKLAQGEFVAPANLEAVFATSPLIQQIYVYGNSEQSFLLAVVVPAAESINQLAGGDAEAVRSAIARSLKDVGAAAGLNGYEIPRNFVIETEPFSIGNGLIAGLGKYRRPNLKVRYGERLEQMYAAMAHQRESEVRGLRRASADRPVLETLSRAVAATLGLTVEDIDPGRHFTDLGGDSLSALTISNLLADIFAVDVPVSMVINPAGDLQQLADYIDTKRRTGISRPTHTTVHAGSENLVRASDLTLDKFIDTEILDAAGHLGPPQSAIRTVVLTGATGYLGRFLLIQWLQRLAPIDGRVFCIARGQDEGQARGRIEAALDTDVELMQLYRDLAPEHLEVLPGDIGQPNLGLDDTTWNWLCDNADLIVHPAAHVNHVLPYEQLFNANVVGTAEVIRLAITSRLKPLAHISTAAVAFLDDGVLDENADVRSAAPVRSLVGTYGTGYATSKWAGEVLVREANSLCGLPVAVFRCDMILGHSRYGGQLNVSDIFTRLLLSVVATGLAPGSFYLDGKRARSHYDGLPVDFIAESISELVIRRASTGGFQTYNVVNPHDDGISLDQFIDWLIDAGHPIRRIPDYADWLSRFEIALRALPDRQRADSVLPVLDAYREPAEPVAGSPVPATEFRVAVQEAGIGPIGDIPHLTPELIHKYVGDLRKLEML